MHHFPFLVFFSSFYSTPNCPHVYTHTHTHTHKLHSTAKQKLKCSLLLISQNLYTKYDEILFVVLDLKKNIIILPFICTEDSLFIFLSVSVIVGVKNYA